MRNFVKTILLISTAFMLFGCGSSNFGSGKDVTTLPRPTDPVTPFAPDTDPVFTTQHCGDINANQHQFYSFMKNVRSEEALAELAESQGICHRSARAQTDNCNFWNQQPLGITFAFFRGFPQTASIALDFTGNGFPNNGGPGFEVRQANQIGGQIDCSQPDLTINSFTSHGWLQIIADREFGNKNAADIRAQIIFNGQNLGTTFFRRQ